MLTCKSPEHGRQHSICFPTQWVVSEVGDHERSKNRYLPCNPDPYICGYNAIASSSSLRRVKVHLSYYRVCVRNHSLCHGWHTLKGLVQCLELSLAFLREGHPSESREREERPDGTADLEKDLRPGKLHISRSWHSVIPTFLVGEVSCPKHCVKIGVASSDRKCEG
jgi:hypothetical protein